MTVSILANPKPQTLLDTELTPCSSVSSYEALAGLIDTMDALLKTQGQPLNPLDRVEVNVLVSMTKRILQRNGFPVAGAPHLFKQGIRDTSGHQLTSREALYKCLLIYETYTGNHACLIEQGWTILRTADATQIEMSGVVTDIITFCTPS